MPNETLIDAEFITSKLTTDDPWCSSHGSGNGLVDLGAGMLYYAIAYALKAKTCVCLGSGGGFVPRMMRQAQRDLNVEGSRTILVDGSPKVDPHKQKIWGIPCWLPEDSVFRANYPEIEIILELTKTAFEDYFVPKDVRIDFLHIDADHHYEGVKLDWDLFHTLVPDSGVITLHDTINFREPCGVPRLLEEIRQHGDFGVVNLPIAYGTAIIKKHVTR